MSRSKRGFISRTYSHIQRYRQILFVLLKYGFDDLFQTLHVEEYVPFGWRPLRRKSLKHTEQLSRAARIRMVLQELGPTFIKIGQTLSMRSDLLPAEYLKELTKLQDRVPPFPFSEVQKAIEKELGAPYLEKFLAFDEVPIAAGSLGQVHRAVLPSGDVVAVKVQRPQIQRTIESDLEIMYQMAGLLENHLELAQTHHATQIVEEFDRTLKQELDYRIESANISRFARQFSDDKRVYVHKVYSNYSTSRMLTTEFIDGIKPTRLSELREHGLDPVAIANTGSNLIMVQVFEYGFFHADPHPGNLMILENEVISYLDFGMMGRLDRQSREAFAELLYAVVREDEVQVADTLLKLTHGHNLLDRLGLERQIRELIDQYLFRPLKDLEVGNLVRSLLDLTSRHGLSIPAPYFLLLKALSQAESLGRSLDPDFDLAKKAGPYVARALRSRYHPKRIARDLYESGTDLMYLVKEVPGEIRELLKQARQGRLRMEFEHIGLTPLLKTLDRLSRLVSSAIVLASLIIGSSLIVLSKVPPRWHDIPIIGLAGFIVSGLLGFAMLRGIRKSGD